MATAALPMPPRKRGWLTAVLMLATLIVILDTTIANVALPHMEAALGASSETIAWVLTSYILASAIALPLTGWLTARLGRRRLFTGAVAGFTLSSALCGLAGSLETMVAARILQGLCGAFLVPMSQAIMYDINPPERHVRAMTLWGMVIMVGPIAGPILGGWITENFDWRWIFYVNLPIGIAAAVGSWMLLEDRQEARRRFDLLGFALLAVALASVQLMLDRGVQLDWFDSPEIWIEAATAVAALWMFVIHTASRDDTLLPRALFADRNFATAIVTVTVVGGILVAGAALVAPMLQRLLGYPVFDAGLVTAPRGVGTVIGMLIAGRIAPYVDARMTIAVGLTLLGVSLWMMTGFDLGMDSRLVLWSGAVQGLGMGLTVLPLNLLAFATLSPTLRNEAAALYNLMRSIGGSIAISLMTALIARNVQVSHSDLGQHVTQVQVPLEQSGLLEQLGLRGEAALALIDAEVNRQAAMIAYIDDYWAMMWAAFAIVPLVLLMRQSKRGASAPPDTGH